MNTFEAGQMVESKVVPDKIGTVVSTTGDVVLVRWDGDKEGVYVQASRLRPKTVKVQGHDFDRDHSEFKRGDYLEVVTDKFGVVRGTALTDFIRFGYAGYELLAEDGNYYALNSNCDKFTVLFRADIARGTTPKY